MCDTNRIVSTMAYLDCGILQIVTECLSTPQSHAVLGMQLAEIDH